MASRRSATAGIYCRAARYGRDRFHLPPKGVKWKDTLALTTAVSRDAFRRQVFELVEADEQGVTGGASVAQVRMAAGDVCFFYTHWLHRAPAPPASVAEGARVCLFGVFGKKAASRRAAPSSGIKHHMCSANVHPRRLA